MWGEIDFGARQHDQVDAAVLGAALGVSLLATGWNSANPAAEMRSGAWPSCPERGGRCAWRGPSRAPSWSRTRRCGWECCRCGLRCAGRRACGQAMRRSGAVWAVFPAGGRGAGVKEAGLAQADHQAVAAHVNGDGVRGHLVGERLLQLAPNADRSALTLAGRAHLRPSRCSWA
jgi:hypothetical protein